MNRHPNDGGWTLLELMAVVLILGILVGIAVASYTMSLEKSRRVTCQMNQRALNNAVLSFAEEHSALPTDLAGVRDLVSVADGEYARCPTDHATEYQYDPLTGSVRCPRHPAQ